MVNFRAVSYISECFSFPLLSCRTVMWSWQPIWREKHCIVIVLSQHTGRRFSNFSWTILSFESWEHHSVTAVSLREVLGIHFSGTLRRRSIFSRSLQFYRELLILTPRVECQKYGKCLDCMVECSVFLCFFFFNCYYYYFLSYFFLGSSDPQLLVMISFTDSRTSGNFWRDP